MNGPPIFRTLESSEVEAAYSIYMDTFNWLKKKEIRQWLVPKKQELFEKDRANKGLYGLFVGNMLACIACMDIIASGGWSDITLASNALWIYRLAVADFFRGRKLGEYMMERLKDCARTMNKSHLYLDCVDVDNFLPAYYEKLGFRRLGAKDITYPSGNTFPMVLLEAVL